MKKKYIILCSFLFVVIDQLIKLLVVNYISPYEEIVVIKSFFSLTNIGNDGAAFGILSSNVLFLIFVSLILIYYVFNEMRKSNEKYTIISLLLILSGSLGNLIDRVFRGYVVDYLSFNIFNRSMPVFNFADILITFGVFMLIIIVVKGGINENRSK